MGAYLGQGGVFSSGGIRTFGSIKRFCGGTKLWCSDGTSFGGINSAACGNNLNSELSAGKLLVDLN